MIKILSELHGLAQRQALAVYLNIAIIGYFVLALLYGLYYSGAVGFLAIQCILLLPVVIVWFFYIELLLWTISKWRTMTAGKRIGAIVIAFLYTLTVAFTLGLLYLTYS